MIQVIPAILEKEFTSIEKKIHLVEGLVDWVQIDIADNTLVSNSTFLDPVPFKKLTATYSHPELDGVPHGTRLVSGSMGMPKQVRHDPENIGINLELHLMVKDPLRYVERFADVGFKRFYAHVEGDYVDDYIALCYKLGVEVGLAIDGPTPLEKIEPYIDNVDCLLVMAIEAGESGRPYREETTDRIKRLRELDFEIPLAVDGAMDDINAKKVILAGANRINSNSYIFKSENIEDILEAINNLKKP